MSGSGVSASESKRDTSFFLDSPFSEASRGGKSIVGEAEITASR